MATVAPGCVASTAGALHFRFVAYTFAPAGVANAAASNALARSISPSVAARLEESRLIIPSLL